MDFSPKQLFIIIIFLLSVNLVSADLCNQYGINKSMSTTLYDLDINRCAYDGPAGSVYLNLTQYASNITSANLTMSLDFPYKAKASITTYKWNGSGYSVFYNVTDSTFAWNASQLLRLKLDYDITPGFTDKFNVSSYVTGVFNGTPGISASFLLDPVIACNPPANDWIIENSTVVFCDGEILTINIYVNDYSSLTLNNSIIDYKPGIVIFQENATAHFINTSIRDVVSFQGRSRAILDNISSSTQGLYSGKLIINNSHVSLIGSTLNENISVHTTSSLEITDSTFNGYAWFYDSSNNTIKGSTFNSQVFFYNTSKTRINDSSRFNQMLYLLHDSNTTITNSTVSTLVANSSSNSTITSSSITTARIDDTSQINFDPGTAIASLLLYLKTGINLITNNLFSMSPSASAAPFIPYFSNTSISSLNLLFYGAASATMANSTFNNITTSTSTTLAFNDPSSYITNLNVEEGNTTISGYMSLSIGTFHENATVLRYFPSYFYFQNYNLFRNKSISFSNSSDIIWAFTTDNNGYINLNHTFTNITKGQTYYLNHSSTTLATLTLSASTPLNITYTDLSNPSIDAVTISGYAFSAANPIASNQMNISSNSSDAMEIDRFEYLVYDHLGKFSCNTDCFRIVSQNKNTTNLEQTVEWKYLFYFTNTTNSTPINLSLSGSDGIIRGIFDLDGSNNTYFPQNATLLVVNANSSISYFILRNSSNNNISYTSNSTFTATDPFGASKTWIMNSDFNVSNSILENNYHINITAYDFAGRTNRSTTSMIYIDETSPIINSISFNDDYVQNNTLVTLTLNVTDLNIMNVTSAYVNFTNSSDLWTGTIYLSGASSSISINATDSLNNSVGTSINYTIDDTSPIINYVGISDNVIRSSTNITYSVNVSGESNATIAYVTAEGNTLEWDGTLWTGSGPISNDGIVNISVIDEAENNATNASISYITDDIMPGISFYTGGTSMASPLSGSTATLYFNLTDNLNISNTYYLLDGTIYMINSSIFQSYSNSSALMNLGVGRHVFILYVNDTANNINSSEQVFYSTSQLNTTAWDSNLTTHLTGQVSGVELRYSNSSPLDYAGNESMLNRSYELNMTTNSKAILVSIKNFNGLSANWNKQLNITDIVKAESVKSNIENSFSTDIEDMVYVDLNGFLDNQSDYHGAVRLPLNASLYTSLWYFGNKSNLSSYLTISECSGIYVPGNDPCYSATSSGKTWVYVPHYSIIVGNNDTTGPNITITGPLNNSVLNQSFDITLSFTTAESSNCNYTWNTGTAAPLGSGSSFSYIFGDYNANGDYNINITCYDSYNNTNSIKTFFTVNDTIAPAVTGGSPSSTQISSPVTLTATTNENATCRYSTDNIGYASMPSANELSGSPSKTHTGQVNITTSGTHNFYISCIDLSSNAMSSAYKISFQASLGSDDGGSGGGGGGDDSNSSTTSVNIIGQSASQFWSSVDAGTTVNMKINNANIPIINISIAAKNPLASANLKVSELTGKPSAGSELIKVAYKYLSLTPTNMGDSELNNVSIRYKVKKSWVDANTSTEDDIALFRFSSVWVQLPTTKLSSDEDNIYYESITPGFSYFAIASTTKTITSSLTAFGIIDVIREFYEGTSSYSAFEIIDMIREFYKV